MFFQKVILTLIFSFASFSGNPVDRLSSIFNLDSSKFASNKEAKEILDKLSEENIYSFFKKIQIIQESGGKSHFNQKKINLFSTEQLRTLKEKLLRRDYLRVVYKALMTRPGIDKGILFYELDSRGIADKQLLANYFINFLSPKDLITYLIKKGSLSEKNLVIVQSIESHLMARKIAKVLLGSSKNHIRIAGEILLSLVKKGWFIDEPRNGALLSLMSQHILKHGDIDGDKERILGQLILHMNDGSCGQFLRMMGFFSTGVGTTIRFNKKAIVHLSRKTRLQVADCLLAGWWKTGFEIQAAKVLRD